LPRRRDPERTCIDTNSTAAERVNIFSTTLKELARQGGAAALLSGHAKANPAS
jgi:hypothetical protein